MKDIQSVFSPLYTDFPCRNSKLLAADLTADLRLEPRECFQTHFREFPQDSTTESHVPLATHLGSQKCSAKAPFIELHRRSIPPRPRPSVYGRGKRSLATPAVAKSCDVTNSLPVAGAPNPDLIASTTPSHPIRMVMWLACPLDRPMKTLSISLNR
jgi:hypothetical protein